MNAAHASFTSLIEPYAPSVVGAVPVRSIGYLADVEAGQRANPRVSRRIRVRSAVLADIARVRRAQTRRGAQPPARTIRTAIPDTVFELCEEREVAVEAIGVALSPPDVAAVDLRLGRRPDRGKLDP